MDEDRLVLTEVKTLVSTIREDIKDMREEIRRSNQDKVTRLEWMQRNETVDQRFGKQGSEISEIKQTMATRIEVDEIKNVLASKRVSIPVVIAITLSILTLGWTILGPAITGSTA